MIDSIEFSGFALLHPAWLLLVPPLLIGACLFTETRDAHDWRRVMSVPVWRFLAGDAARRPRGRAGWRDAMNGPLLAAALVCVALSAPATRQSEAAAWQHDSGWFALVDLSRSMTLGDTAPSRLAAARHSLDRLAEASGARPLALVIYAGDAFLAAAPALDKRLYAAQAALLDHGLIPDEGSNPTRALALATAVANDSGVTRARFFLLTDSGGIGEATERAATALAKRGHRLDVVLFGSRTGGRGAVDEPAASKLAAAGNGELVRVGALGQFEPASLDADTRLEPVEEARLGSLVWKLQSHWLLLLLLPLLLSRFRRDH